MTMQTVLFPTDGSLLSEEALPIALDIASAQGAGIKLVQVVQYLQWVELGPEGYVSADVYQQVMDALDAEAQKNLDTLAGRVRDRGVPVETTLLHGGPALGVLDAETETQADLVVMATHGRTGLARFARGSIADTILREGKVPVLLVRSFATRSPELSSAVVPLDGSELAEEALPIVETLAGKPIRRVRLVRAIADLDERADALIYLAGVEGRLALSGLDVDVMVPIGPAQDAIAEAAGTADLVIMATHGRGGLDRLRHGSVAEHALREVSKPVLMVRAGAAAHNPEVVATSSLSV